LLADDQYEYAGTTPAGISIKGEEMLSASWSDLFVQVLKHLFLKDGELLIALLNKTKSNILTTNPDNLFIPKKISDDYYVETNNSTEKKVRILASLFADFQYELDDIIVFIK
jgi:hypothetical protein